MGLLGLLKAAMLDQAVTAAAKSPAMQSTAQKVVTLQKDATGKAAGFAAAAVYEVRNDISNLFSKLSGGQAAGAGKGIADPLLEKGRSGDASKNSAGSVKGK